MASIRNPKDFDIFSSVLDRMVHAFEVIEDLTEEVAEKVCETGIFDRYSEVHAEPVAVEPVAEPASTEPELAPEGEPTTPDPEPENVPVEEPNPNVSSTSGADPVAPILGESEA